MKSTPWTPWEIKTLRKCLSDGLSSAETAKNLPIRTKNAVIGQAHRLGIPMAGGRPWNEAQRDARMKIPPAPLPRSKTDTALLERAGELIKSSAITLARQSEAASSARKHGIPMKIIEAGECRWIINDDLRMAVCCGMPAPHGPYCNDHQLRTRREIH